MSTVPSTTKPLRDLARARMRVQGWTLSDLERNANKAKSRAWFGERIAEQHRDRPLKDQDLEALADGLRLPVEQVRRADLAGHGLRVDSQDPDAAPMTDVPEAIRRDSRLLPEARQHLLNQYQLLLRIQALSPEALAEQEERRTAEDEQAQVYAEDHADLDETRAQQDRGEPTRLTEKRRTRRIR